MIKYVIGCDPSGNFSEGKGHTGLCVLDRETNVITWTGYTYAGDYDTFEEYYLATWKELWRLYHHVCNEDAVISIEDYRLYGHKSQAQVNSLLETPRIIGYLLMQFYRYDIDYYIRCAVQVKKRWAEPVLAHYGYIQAKGKGYILPADGHRLVTHELDSIKHAVHCSKFELT